MCAPSSVVFVSKSSNIILAVEKDSHAPRCSGVLSSAGNGAQIIRLQEARRVFQLRRLRLDTTCPLTKLLNSRLLFAAVSIYICWQIFATVVFDPLLDWADLEWDSLSEKEKKEMEELAEDDEPLLFLPFPFTTTEVKQPPYKGTDPEWLTFLAVNKDAQAQKDIKCKVFGPSFHHHLLLIFLLLR